MRARIEPASAPFPAAVTERLEKIMPSGIPPLWLFRVMARDERLFARFVGVNLLGKGRISVRERELTILRMCAKNGSEYEWGVHVSAFAEEAKLSRAEIYATVYGAPNDPIWDERESLVLSLSDMLCAGTRLSDEFWSELSDEFEDEAILELLLLNGHYRTVSCLTNALEMPLEVWAARFPPPPTTERARSPSHEI